MIDKIRTAIKGIPDEDYLIKERLTVELNKVVKNGAKDSDIKEFLEKNKGSLPNVEGLLSDFGKATGEFPLKKIVSGLQKNVDQAGIRAAWDLGLDYGGTVSGLEGQPWRVVPEGDNIIDLEAMRQSGDHPWKVLPTKDYVVRTAENATINSDGTVWFGTEDSKGYQATKREKGNKPWKENPTVEELRQWIIDNDIKTLNVAGPRPQEVDGKYSNESGRKAYETLMGLKEDIGLPPKTEEVKKFAINPEKGVTPEVKSRIVPKDTPGSVDAMRGGDLGNPFYYKGGGPDGIVKISDLGNEDANIRKVVELHKTWLETGKVPDGLSDEQIKRLAGMREQQLKVIDNLPDDYTLGYYKPDATTSHAITLDDFIQERKKSGTPETPKEFEVSTKGDSFGKQFSALNATFKEGPYAGRTIEDVWQNEIKKSGKKQGPGEGSILRFGDYQQSKDEYQKLWQMWADENPDLISQLKAKVDEGYILKDSWATGDPNKTVNQAEALTNVLNQKTTETPAAKEPKLKAGDETLPHDFFETENDAKIFNEWLGGYKQAVANGTESQYKANSQGMFDMIFDEKKKEKLRNWMKDTGQLSADAETPGKTPVQPARNVSSKGNKDVIEKLAGLPENLFNSRHFNARASGSSHNINIENVVNGKIAAVGSDSLRIVTGHQRHILKSDNMYNPTMSKFRGEGEMKQGMLVRLGTPGTDGKGPDGRGPYANSPDIHVIVEDVEKIDIEDFIQNRNGHKLLHTTADKLRSDGYQWLITLKEHPTDKGRYHIIDSDNIETDWKPVSYASGEPKPLTEAEIRGTTDGGYVPLSDTGVNFPPETIDDVHHNNGVNGIENVGKFARLLAALDYGEHIYSGIAGVVSKGLMSLAESGAVSPGVAKGLETTTKIIGQGSRTSPTGKPTGSVRAMKGIEMYNFLYGLATGLIEMSVTAAGLAEEGLDDETGYRALLGEEYYQYAKSNGWITGHQNISGLPAGTGGVPHTQWQLREAENEGILTLGTADVFKEVARHNGMEMLMAFLNPEGYENQPSIYDVLSKTSDDEFYSLGNFYNDYSFLEATAPGHKLSHLLPRTGLLPAIKRSPIIMGVEIPLEQWAGPKVWPYMEPEWKKFQGWRERRLAGHNLQYLIPDIADGTINLEGNEEGIGMDSGNWLSNLMGGNTPSGVSR